MAPTVDTSPARVRLTNPELEVSAAEAIELAAIDRDFFAQFFFPRTARQKIPPFHHRIWDRLESSARLVNLLVYRGGGKTSILRMYIAKRIGYGLSRTILVIGKSEQHATRTVRWLRRQIEIFGRYAQVFQLEKGMKWQDHECEIFHRLRDHTVTILAMGIGGSVRGVNIDDFRPDLIVLDDVLDEENAATGEQRKKINELVYGALKESLAPAVDAPDAKLVSLTTPQNREDYAVEALGDPEWVSERFGCWTPETESHMVGQQESQWEERFPSEQLRKEKIAAVRRNQLSLWMREKECKITAPETSSFVAGWLRTYDLAPSGLYTVGAIDPVPPPSEKQIQQGLKDKDYEAIVSIGRRKNDYYLLEYSLNRGHEPTWTVAEFFRHSLLYRPRRWLVEGVAYQRTLAWILRQAMNHQKKYFVVQEFLDQRSKFNRIVDALSGIASNGHLYIKREHVEFIQQFSDYPSVSHDDLLDAVTIAMIGLEGSLVTDPEEDFDDGDEYAKPLTYRRELMAP